jgi:hypothetical protein
MTYLPDGWIRYEDLAHTLQVRPDALQIFLNTHYPGGMRLYEPGVYRDKQTGRYTGLAIRPEQQLLIISMIPIVEKISRELPIYGKKGTFNKYAHKRM